MTAQLLSLSLSLSSPSPYLAAYSYTPESHPPWQEPASPQAITFWVESMVGGEAPLRWMLSRSASADVDPYAQQEPQ